MFAVLGMAPLDTTQDLQWLLLCGCLLYGLHVTGVFMGIWNSCKSLCKGGQGDGSVVYGPDQDVSGGTSPPQWMQGFVSSFEKLAEWCEESRKILRALAAQRPHLDLLPEIKTQCDLLKVDSVFIRGKLDAGETRRQVYGTNGLEAIIHNITTCIKGQQNFASVLPKIVKTEHDEIKQEMHRLESKLDMLAEAHGDIQELMRKVVGMLEAQGSMLETVAKKGAPEQPPPASPKAETSTKTEGLKVPDYVPSVPHHNTPATVSLSDALGPPRTQPAQAGPDIFATMAMCMEMMRTMHQHHANANARS
eukprot:s4913_g10.t1